MIRLLIFKLNVFIIAPTLRGFNGKAAQKIGLIVYSIGAMQHACRFREKDILKKHYMIVVKLIKEAIEIIFDWLPLTAIILIIITISQYLFHLYINFNT